MKTNKKYGKKVDLALNTWIKLARAFSTINKKSTESIKRFGLTQPQFSVIEVLGHLGPLKVGEICEKMLVSGGNMTLVLDNIAKLGYIERVHDLNDRRAIQVQLTAKGAELFDKIFAPHAEFISETMSVLTANEQKELGILLRKLGTTIR
ncbi:MAG: MarR family transcriptional regulator [Melioribacteraceae bacterium]|jgi:MarR family 2-MHQ and catechol resistance regulon transcriptional repressor|nr:MarR family transcriptional regulator [Melioribacteraceae bacterium]